MSSYVILWTIDDMFESVFGFQYSQSFQCMEYNYKKKKKNVVFMISIFLHGEIFALPNTFRDMAHNLLSDRLWAPLL